MSEISLNDDIIEGNKDNNTLSQEKKSREISEFIKLINELKLKVKEVKEQLVPIKTK